MLDGIICEVVHGAPDVCYPFFTSKVGGRNSKYKMLSVKHTTRFQLLTQCSWLHG